jgi:UDP-N-acetylglucosamine acyltransferase
VPIHPTAVVDPKAELDSSVEVGPHCVIEEHVRVAAGCRLYHNVYLTGWTEIGEDCVLHPGVIIGHMPQDIKYGGERTYCRIGKRNILREYVTIHRGTMPESTTALGDDCFLLAGSHVGHNCTVGNRVTMVNNVLLGGHVTVQDRVTFGGSAVVHQFVRVGELAMIAGNTRIAMDIVPFALTDEEGRIAGLNRIGLRRAELPREHVQELRLAYRTLFERGVSFKESVERLAATAQSPPAKRLLAFLQTDSKRGIAGRARNKGAGSGPNPE